MFTFLKLLQLIKRRHNWFLKKWKQYINEKRFCHHNFLFFMCDDLSFINTTQKTLKPSKKNVSIPRMDEKKLHTLEFQLNGIGGKMRCKLLQKRSTGKTTECSKHLWHIAIEKDIYSELIRCIFQISQKYIKLVIPKILFFYFKIMWPLAPNKIAPQQYNPRQNKNFCPPAPPPPTPRRKDFSKIFTPPGPPKSGERGAWYAIALEENYPPPSPYSNANPEPNPNPNRG